MTFFHMFFKSSGFLNFLPQPKKKLIKIIENNRKQSKILLIKNIKIYIYITSKTEHSKLSSGILLTILFINYLRSVICLLSESSLSVLLIAVSHSSPRFYKDCSIFSTYLLNCSILFSNRFPIHYLKKR